MKANEIRERFLSHFEGHGHARVASSALIPHNDPTLFFTNAGMVQFKDVFLGHDPRAYTRATTVQKCLRVSGKHNDLENVGHTPRHHTFFEMLGNFSFGDYFKRDAIPMAWSLITEGFQLDPERLWVTVFETDDEAFDIWRQTGVRADRIQRLGEKDNFWSMGDTGPCGPCSEIFFDHGPGVSSDTRGPAGGDDRYVEIWNLVFMQYNQDATGTRTALPRPSIDTGAGLERVAAALQGVYSNYDTDLFQPIIQRAARAADVRYGANTASDIALKVIADHARAAAFLVADGVMPSNEGRGYVLRRIMRRAVRYGVKLGVEQPFLYDVSLAVVDDFAHVYPDLGERRSFIHEVVRGEEERFRRTLDRGMKLLDAALDKAGSGGVVPGEVAFVLSDTYGFPLDLTQLIAAERDVRIDDGGYEAALGAQKARGRAAWKGSGEEAVGALWHQLAHEHGSTQFTGYHADEDVGTVVALLRLPNDGAQGEAELVDRLAAGEHGIVLLDKTPFYAESGGQVGDHGRIGPFTVRDTRKASGLHLHDGIATGPVATGDLVGAHVDGGRRDHTRRNHTATHLLHAALRKVLGAHVTQKGSLVAPDRLRFDFSHHKPVTADELSQIEQLVNDQTLRNEAVDTSVEAIDDAIARGAMALFGEKYDDEVRVVRVPGFSVELCGGTHVKRTGDIGLFKLVSESGVAAGVRRIEAQTGAGALAFVNDESAKLLAAAAALKAPPGQLVEAIQRLQDERRALERELAALQREAAKTAAGTLLNDARDISGVKVLAGRFDGDLREQADRLRDQLGTALVVLFADRGDSVQIVSAATKDIAGSRVHAGKLLQEVAPLVGGRGGGRPDMAQGGGTDAAGIDAAIDRVYAWAEATLAG